MKPKKLNRPVTGNVKQVNMRKERNDNRNTNYKTKNVVPGHHYIASNNDSHHYNKNMVYDNKKENHKYVADIAESIRRGRNTSAPALKKNKNNKSVKNNKNIKTNYNKISNVDDYSANKKHNISHMNESRDDKKYKNNISYEKIKKKDNNKINFSNKITKINRRIKNIKDNYNSKTNRKLYNNTINNNKEITNDVLAAQVNKIALMKKKLKENEYNNKNNNTFNNKMIGSNSNTYTYGNENEEEDDKKIVIDNGENILSTEDNADYYNKETSRDITPEKRKSNERKNDNKKNMNNSGYSYNKKSEHIRKINLPKIGKTRNDRDNNLFNNNYNTVNKNNNTDRDKNDKKKSKKINIINLKTKQNDYYYTKSSNMFNTTNNNLNRTVVPNQKKLLNNSHEKKVLNKSKVDDMKKNNSVRKTKPKTDFYNTNTNTNNNNNIFNKIIGKRNSDKTKIQKNKGINKTLNYTYDKINNNLNSSKIKKIPPKTKNTNKYEHKVTIELDKPTNEEKKEKEVKKEKEEEEEREEEEEKEEEKEKEEDEEENNVEHGKNIEKIGCVCHAGEITFGKPKTNQDNYFNYKFKREGVTFVGVCDGHGENGHYVSEFLINHMPQDLQETYLNSINDSESFESIPYDRITQIFEDSFLKTDNDLNALCDKMKKRKLEGESNPNFFNCDYSGSTCVSLLLKQKDISTVYVANVGDSRTIVIKENNSNSWTYEQLSRDHKPTEKDEYQRIIDMDGEIEAIEDDNGNWTGPLRVWEKGSEGPGLAMTRSLGDKVGTRLGVVCTPEVTKYIIKSEDRAFIIASDGLWEYMPNQEVCDFVKELIQSMRQNNNEVDAELIAKELFDQSVLRWRQKEQGMDDITIIVVLLN